MSARKLPFSRKNELSGEVIEMMDVARPKIETYSTMVWRQNQSCAWSFRCRGRAAMPDEWDDEFLTSNSEKLQAIPKFDPIGSR